MKTITIEVTATVRNPETGKDELFGTSRDIDVASNLSEAIETDADAEQGVYKRYIDAIRNEARELLRGELVSAVDPAKAKKRSTAKFIKLG